MLDAILARNDLGDFRHMIEEISGSLEAEHSRLEMIVKADWRVNVEIALEDIHVPTVHRETFHKLGIKLDSLERYGKDSIAMYTVTGERVLKGLRAVQRYFLNVSPEQYFHLFIYPSTFLSSVGGFTYSVQECEPLLDGTLFRSTLYRPILKPGAPDLTYFFDNAAAFNKRVFEEDAEACERIGKYDATGPLCAEEERIKWFRQAQHIDWYFGEGGIDTYHPDALGKLDRWKRNRQLKAYYQSIVDKAGK
jgi:phenylpropionate dioxygenase-like ring-hydroxylating dioxygenase large terminal subunit